MKFTGKRVIWFDLGYTLLKLDREKRLREILSELDFHFTEEALAKAFHITDKLFMRQYPGILGKNKAYYMPMYLGNLLYFLNIKTDTCVLYKMWEDKLSNPYKVWAPFDFSADTLEYLKNTGYELGVISNWDKTAVPLLEMHNLRKFFDYVVISSEVGYEKPHPEIFRIAFRKASADASECLYVGDNFYDDGAGSREVGMDFVIINSYGRLGIEELENCTIIPDIRSLRSML